jgi:hypothetical protein
MNRHIDSPNVIFVFGSNLAGRHGAGAALHARRYFGAVYGEGVGPTGRAYGIPTKDGELKTLPLEAIEAAVKQFIRYARAHENLTFLVTAIGCGYAGYQPQQIAPFFAATPENCFLSPHLVRLD